MATLVVALDIPEPSQALSMAQTLKGQKLWLKVGLELFSLGGPDLVHNLKNMNFKVFLDLKLHDIPNTVQSAVRAIQSMGVDMLTIHTLGGERMARAAMAGLDPTSSTRPLVMGVTVLTSTAEGELPGYSQDISTLVHDLATSANHWGLDGVVSSGFEVRGIKQHCRAQFLCLSPGIRPAGSAGDDQRRIMTPAQAVQAGADFLVVGRPITRSSSPVQSVHAILAEMETALCQRTTP